VCSTKGQCAFAPANFSISINNSPPHIDAFGIYEIGIDYLKANCSATDINTPITYDISFNLTSTGTQTCGFSNLTVCDVTCEGLINNTNYTVTFTARDSIGDVNITNTTVITKSSAIKTYTPQGDLNLRERYRLLNIWKTSWVSPNGTIYNCRMTNGGALDCVGTIPTNLSQLINDVDFINRTTINELIENKSYINSSTLNTTYLKLDGTNTMQGNINVGDNEIDNIQKINFNSSQVLIDGNSVSGSNSISIGSSSDATADETIAIG
ncbi:unnamed protein product, partial [marine sediment metagenome]